MEGDTVFSNNYRKLRVSFNEFHNVDKDDMPEYGEFCLLELKDGGYTGGEWIPKNYGKKLKTVAGGFVRGTADTVPVGDVSKWHFLHRYDLTESLKDEEINWINLGVEGEDIYSVQFKDFKSTRDGDYPKEEQYCLLILMNGTLASGRWQSWRHKSGGTFIYAPALAQHTEKEVWAWTPLSPDFFFEKEWSERGLQSSQA